MVRMLLLSSGHARAVRFSGRLVGHHAAQLYPAQASGTWRKDRSLCGKEQGTWPCVTLSPLLPPPASEQGLRVPFGTPVLIFRPLPGTGPLGFSPRSAPHVHADSAAAFTSGTRSLPQPCSERGGGSRVQCLAPVGGEEGVLCKRPSGSVWFRAVTPLPVSLRHTVTTAASAGCGPVKAGGFPVEKSQPHLRAVRSNMQGNIAESCGLQEDQQRPPRPGCVSLPRLPSSVVFTERVPCGWCHLGPGTHL